MARAVGTLRIVAGTLRGRRLRVLPGHGVRPTPDRVREALFSILGARIRDASVLDLYAGSGAMGFEALSRGARHVTFVEADRRVVRQLADNAEILGVAEHCRIVAQPVERFLAGPGFGESIRVVVADPPYADPPDRIVAALERAHGLEPGAWVVVEREAVTPHAPPSSRLKLFRSVTYGRTRLDFHRFEGAGGGGPEPSLEFRLLG